MKIRIQDRTQTILVILLAFVTVFTIPLCTQYLIKAISLSERMQWHTKKMITLQNGTEIITLDVSIWITAKTFLL